MICPKCGANAAEGDNFCEECGASIKKVSSAKCSCEECREDLKKYPNSDVIVIDSALAAASNIGRRHAANEDSGTAMRCEDGSIIMVVADGVSSAVNATSASLQAVNKVKELLSESPAIDMDLIKSAINKANDVILELPYETRAEGIYGPETTIVAALVKGDNVLIGWVGDSRAYIISKNEQKLLTIDDSWIELVVAAGDMTRSQAIKDRRAHYVTQVLGMHDQTMEVHVIENKIEKDQMLLLCSDGLWNYLQGDDDILKAILDFGIEKDAAEICEHLIELANNAGGHDNITTAIAKF